MGAAGPRCTHAKGLRNQPQQLRLARVRSGEFASADDSAPQFPTRGLAGDLGLCRHLQQPGIRRDARSVDSRRLHCGVAPSCTRHRARSVARRAGLPRPHARHLPPRRQRPLDAAALPARLRPDPARGCLRRIAARPDRRLSQPARPRRGPCAHREGARRLARARPQQPHARSRTGRRGQLDRRRRGRLHQRRTPADWRCARARNARSSSTNAIADAPHRPHAKTGCRSVQRRGSAQRRNSGSTCAHVRSLCSPPTTSR